MPANRDISPDTTLTAKKYKLLTPIKVDALRLKLGTVKMLEEPINSTQLFQSTINHFEKFAVGLFFWFIIDLINWSHIDGGGDIENLTPLKKSDFIFGGNPQKLHEITHPDDLPQVMAFSNFWIDYFTTLVPERRPFVRVTLYFRILNKERKYYWIMVQYADNILNTSNKFEYNLILVTDISHIKQEGQPLMSILDTYEGSCQQFVCFDSVQIDNQQKVHRLSLREIEVLHYLARGFSSKQIAGQLKIAVKTIDNHRQNMLHKTQTKSSAELVNYCIKSGYL